MKFQQIDFSKHKKRRSIYFFPGFRVLRQIPCQARWSNNTGKYYKNIIEHICLIYHIPTPIVAAVVLNTTIYRFLPNSIYNDCTSGLGFSPAAHLMTILQLTSPVHLFHEC